MQLSSNTQAILKNFASINPNLVFNTGSKLTTISEAKNIVAAASIEEAVDTKFGIYDLDEFLSAINLVDKPELQLGESSVSITDGRTSIQYFYADETVLTTPSKKVTMPTSEVVIVLSEDVLAKIKKAAAAFGHSSISVNGEDGVVSVTTLDTKNSSSNKYTLVIDEENSAKNKFSLVLAIGNLKLLGGDYEVSLSSKGISHWKNLTAPVEYWIALETTSTFKK